MNSAWLAAAMTANHCGHSGWPWGHHASPHAYHCADHSSNRFADRFACRSWDRLPFFSDLVGSIAAVAWVLHDASCKDHKSPAACTGHIWAAHAWAPSAWACETDRLVFRRIPACLRCSSYHATCCHLRPNKQVDFVDRTNTFVVLISAALSSHTGDAIVSHVLGFQVSASWTLQSMDDLIKN